MVPPSPKSTFPVVTANTGVAAGTGMLNGPPARDGVTNHSGWAPYHFGSTGKVYNPPDTAVDVVDDGPGVPADAPDGAVAPGAAGFGAGAAARCRGAG